MIRRLAALLLLLLATAPTPTQPASPAQPVGSFADGSLRVALSEAATAFAAVHGAPAAATFGTSTPRAVPSGDDARAAFARAGLFPGCCKVGREAAAELAGLRLLALLDAPPVGADSGLAASPPRPGTARLAAFLPTPPGQAILARHGFTPVAAPQEARS